jgi:hypothetical protein
MVKPNVTSENEGREPLYPLYPLNLALLIGDAVKDLGGVNRPVSKSLLASHLNTEVSQTLTQRISAAKIYGIIQGRAEYVLTEIGKTYYFPAGDDDKRNALVAFFSNPPAFKRLIDRFDGQKIPSTEMLSNILLREIRVPGSWAERVAGFFLRGGEQVGALNESGILHLRALRHRTDVKREEEKPQPTSSDASPQDFPGKELAQSQKRPEAARAGHVVWSYPWKGCYIRLETPENLSLPLWRKLRAYVELLKPFDETSDDDADIELMKEV